MKKTHKTLISHREPMILLKADFLIRNSGDHKSGHIQSAKRKKNCQPNILYPEKLVF